MDTTMPRSRRYVGILALVACVILIGGWLARPRDIPQNPQPVPTETELEQLERRAERRSLDSTAKYFTGIAREVETSIGYIRVWGVSGVTWDDTRVVTSPRPLGWGRAPATVAVASAQITGRPAMGGPNLPLSTLTVVNAASALSPAPRAQSMPGSGNWIVAVWRTESAPAFTVGHFGLSSPITCGVTPVHELVSSLSFTRTMTGGGVFDIDGGLLGVILPCDGRLAAVATASIQSILDRKETVDALLIDRFGLRLAPLSEEEVRYFKTAEGLLVRDVWSGYPADAAGIQPGDIVTAVNGVRVTKTGEITSPMTPADAPLELTLSRGPARLTRTLAQTADTAPDAASRGTGVVIEEPPSAYRIESIRPDSRAAAAGIQPGDRLVRIDRAPPRNLDQVKRLMDRETTRPMWIEVMRDGRRLGVLVR